MELQRRLGNTEKSWKQRSRGDIRVTLEKILDEDDVIRSLLPSIGILHHAKRREDTYNILYPNHLMLRQDINGISTNEPDEVDEKTARMNEKVDDILDFDDPWADAANDEQIDVPVPTEPGNTTGSDNSASLQTPPIKNPTDEILQFDAGVSDRPISLSQFLSHSIAISAHSLAASGAILALQIIWERHPAEIYPHRFTLLEALPAWVSPGDLMSNLTELARTYHFFRGWSMTLIWFRTIKQGGAWCPGVPLPKAI